MVIMAKPVDFLLSCRHLKKFREPLPYPGELVYCFRCANMQMIMESRSRKQPGVFSWYCADHHYTQTGRAGKQDAIDRATRHYQKYGSICTMAVLDGGKVIEHWSASDNPLGLTFRDANGKLRQDYPLDAPF